MDRTSVGSTRDCWGGESSLGVGDSDLAVVISAWLRGFSASPVQRWSRCMVDLLQGWSFAGQMWQKAKDAGVQESSVLKGLALRLGWRGMKTKPGRG